MKIIYDESKYDESKIGNRLYGFDEKTGILYVPLESNDLERFIEGVVKTHPQFPKEEINLELCTRYYGEHVFFEGVKEIKSLPNLTKEENFAYAKR